MSSPLVAAEGTLRPMLRLVWPVLLEHLLHLLVMYVDMWLAGHYVGGDASLAAISLSGYVMWMVFTLFALVAVGATAMTARFVGAGDYPSACRVTDQALLAGAALAGLLWLLIGLVGVDGVVRLLNLEGEAHHLAVRYLAIVLPVLPCIMFEEVGIAALRGAGDMVSGLVVMTLVNVINLLVSAGLLLGLAGLPQLGWEGLAWGTACGHGVGGVIVLVLLLRGRAGLRLRAAGLRPDLPLIRRLLRIGIPGGADAIFIVGCHWWYLSIINGLGDLAAAAHGIGIRIEAIAFMPGAAFQMAAATLAGQYLGAGEPRRATRSVLLACATGGAVMMAAGALFYVAAVPLAASFVSDKTSDVIPLAASLVAIVAFTQPALAVQMILGGGLRGAGDTRLPLIFTVVGFLGIRLPLAYLLAHGTPALLGLPIAVPALGVVGAWYAMVVDVFFRCLLVLGRFWQGGWRRVRV